MSAKGHREENSSRRRDVKSETVRDGGDRFITPGGQILGRHLGLGNRLMHLVQERRNQQSFSGESREREDGLQT